jgi:CheY-like chemotaxis protein
MPAGGTLSVSARARTVRTDNREGLAAGRYVRVRVVDTGVGMDEATLRRATEPFFTTKGVGKGTGLGLSMVQGLAVQSGGAMTLRSRPGHGTTVEVWLPRADAAPTDGRREEGRTTMASDTTLTILVVDDDPLVAMGTVAMLEDLGHAVLEASSGRAALELAAAHPEIDVVITDHAMPGMTGVDLARRLAERQVRATVVLSTGYAELPGGVDVVWPRLDKPIRQEALVRLLDLIVRTRG